ERLQGIEYTLRFFGFLCSFSPFHCCPGFRNDRGSDKYADGGNLHRSNLRASFLVFRKAGCAVNVARRRVPPADRPNAVEIVFALRVAESCVGFHPGITDRDQRLACASTVTVGPLLPADGSFAVISCLARCVAQTGLLLFAVVTPVRRDGPGASAVR